MEGLYQKFIIVLLSVVLTGAGAWLTWGREVRSESKVIDLIETHSPYLEDRKLFEKNLEESAELRRTLIDLAGAVRELTVKVDHVIQTHHGEGR